MFARFALDGFGLVADSVINGDGDFHIIDLVDVGSDQKVQGKVESDYYARSGTKIPNWIFTIHYRYTKRRS